MLAELVDHVIGVDPDRDRITVAVVDAKTHGELACAQFPTTVGGYAKAIRWADDFSTSDRRVWSVEGAGSYGAGLCFALTAEAEWAIEFDRPSSRPAKDGAKSDGLDAVRAAREMLGRTKWSTPRPEGPEKGYEPFSLPAAAPSWLAPRRSTSSRLWCSPPRSLCAKSCAA